MFILGHRGAAALEPENTLLSIERAMAIGVGGVEIDIHFTSDKELVVIHDAVVDRTTNGKGPVNSYTLEAIRKLDAGKGQRVPTLQEVVDLTRGKIGLVIELKEEGLEEKIVELIRANDLYATACVISFWHAAPKRIKAIDSRIRTGVLLVGCPVDTCIAGHASADVLVMNYAFVNKAFVEQAHKDGLQVMIWNIDDPERIKHYADMGVDGIASNRPQILVDYFR